jgi:hypothetical protein
MPSGPISGLHGADETRSILLRYCYYRIYNKKEVLGKVLRAIMVALVDHGNV